MKDTKVELQLNGKTYPVVFNLNVMEVIQEEYGTLEEWGNITDAKNGEPNAKAVIFGITEMINEGLDIEADEKGEEYKPLTRKQVGRLITEYGLLEATKKMNNAVVESTKTKTQKNG